VLEEVKVDDLTHVKCDDDINSHLEGMALMLE
jgi:hypothetical protein